MIKKLAKEEKNEEIKYEYGSEKKLKTKNNNTLRKLKILFFLVCFLITFYCNIILPNSYSPNPLNNPLNNDETDPDLLINEGIRKPRTSAVYADCLIINTLNNTQHFRGESIVIRANISNSEYGPEKDINVTISVNGFEDLNFINKTNVYGFVSINYTISENLDLLSTHEIMITVTDDLEINYLNHISITLKANSYIQFDQLRSSSFAIPYLRGEQVRLVGSLNYDDDTGIDDSQILVDWISGSSTFSAGPLITKDDGSYDQTVNLPNSTMAPSIDLRLRYQGVPNIVTGSSLIASKVKTISNISCQWNVAKNVTRGSLLKITGRIHASNDETFAVNGRKVNIFLDDLSVGKNTTTSTGNFTIFYEIPEDEELGLKTLYVQLVTISGYTGQAPPRSQITNITFSATPNTVTGDVNGTVLATQPFFQFLSVFLPVLGGVIAGIVAIGIYLLKKRDKESRAIEVPLGDRIENLKILKETGRLEEALSYLFEAVYMDLVKAKFSRKRNINETIRDFAIVSVKELSLSPATVYPFIQKVESGIYYPYKISERDFYDAVALFSPIYFQLTGYNFQLKF